MGDGEVKKKSLGEKRECIKRVVENSQEHVLENDPKRMYSQYIRYALDEVSDLNLYVSKKASGLKRKDVIVEHVIPHSFVMNKLLALKSVTTRKILNIINKYFIVCKITREEDKLLNIAGLRSKMPEGWDEKKGDVFARYNVVGIEVVRD